MAGSKSDTWEQAVLDHLFLNVAVSLVGDATGLPAAATAGSLYISLHTADPGETGDQTTSETAYTGYARVAVARSGAGWSRSGSTVTNVAVVDSPKCTASPGGAITHFGIGTSSAGAGKLLYSADLTASIVMSVGVIPRAEAGAISITEG